jgi:hypothetical protein
MKISPNEEPPADLGVPSTAPTNAAMARSRSTDWYAEGQARVVRIGSLRIVVTFLGRKGRRARVKIEAPAGAEFESLSSVTESKRVPRDEC